MTWARALQNSHCMGNISNSLHPARRGRVSWASRTGNQLRENSLSVKSLRNPSSAPVQPHKPCSAIPWPSRGLQHSFLVWANYSGLLYSPWREMGTSWSGSHAFQVVIHIFWLSWPKRPWFSPFNWNGALAAMQTCVPQPAEVKWVKSCPCCWVYTINWMNIALRASCHCWKRKESAFSRSSSLTTLM